jgi:hypothetical protein
MDKNKALTVKQLVLDGEMFCLKSRGEYIAKKKTETH